MIDLNDKIWATFEGGYKTKFDTSPHLKELEKLEAPSEKIWETLWEGLYHQGDVGIASYAIIPHLIRIYKKKGWFDSNLTMFPSTIEKARLEEKNPPLPEWLEKDYKHSLIEIAKYSIEQINSKWDFYSLLGLLMLISILQGNPDLTELLNYIDEGQEKELIEKLF